MLGIMRRARAFSVVALLVISGSVPVSLSALVHDAADDAGCLPSVVQHDETRHRIGAARDAAAAPETGHCAVCHWLKSLRTALHATAVTSFTTEIQSIVVALLPAGVSAFEDTLSTRAPPRA